MYNNYEEFQDRFLFYREWKIKELIMPYTYDDVFGNNYSAYHTRYVKRCNTYQNDKVGAYRNWKRYRKNQYRLS